jgi:hypothetical protein
MDPPAEFDLHEMAQQALEDHDRQSRRVLARRVAVAFFLLAPLAGAVAWLLLVGYQRHVLEIETGDRVFRIVSRKGPFEVYTPNDEFAKPREGNLVEPILEDITTNRVEPRLYTGAPYASTRQRVRLADGLVDYQFFVNQVPFSLTRSELTSGELHWQAGPGEVCEINVDRLSPPQPQPVVIKTVDDGTP